MICARQDVRGGLKETDNGEGTNVLGAPAEEGGINGVRS